VLGEVNGGRFALALILAEHACTKVDGSVCHCGLVDFLLLLAAVVDGCCRRCFAVDGVLWEGGMWMREGGSWVIRYREEVVWCRRDGDNRGRGG